MSEEDEKAGFLTKHLLLWRPKSKFDVYHFELTTSQDKLFNFYFRTLLYPCVKLWPENRNLPSVLTTA